MTLNPINNKTKQNVSIIRHCSMNKPKPNDVLSGNPIILKLL